MRVSLSRADGASGAAAASADAQLAAVLVGIGASIRGRLLFTVGLPCVLAGACFAAKAMWGVADRRPVGSRVVLTVALGVMALVGLLAPRGVGPLWLVALRHAYFVLGLAAMFAWHRTGPRLRQGLVYALIACASVLHLAGVWAVPDPFIDTWAWTQTCLRALMGGAQPYSVQPADILHGSYWAGRTAPTYPYMPMTLVAFAPLYLLFGDYRFLGALLFPATVLILRAVGTRLALEQAVIDVSSFVVLLFPRGFALTSMGYIEPLMGFALVGFALVALRRPGGLVATIAFLTLPALKQYFLAPLFLFAVMTRRTSATTLLAASLVVSASTIPFLWWNATATMTGMLTQVTGALTEPRPDATSLVALLVVLGAGTAGRWLSVMMQAAVGALAYWLLRERGMAGLLLGSAMSLLMTFVAGWQAFDNYFWFISLMLALASLFLASPRGLAPSSL